MIETASNLSVRPALRQLPKLGFAGVGWFGRHRLGAVAASGLADVAAIADPRSTALIAAAAHAPDAAAVESFDDLLALKLDGIVLATPTAFHAEQAVRALRAGAAVFCEPPLARNAVEMQHVLEVAHDANRLLGVDLSLRYTSGMRAIKRLIEQGELGAIYAVEMVHQVSRAPEKPWAHDARLAGGGCLIDLGFELLDATFWALGFPAIETATAQLLKKGHSLRRPEDAEDYATGLLTTQNGISLQLSCAWNTPMVAAERIEVRFFGTGGGAVFHNLHGSRNEFHTDRFSPGKPEPSPASEADQVDGQAVVAWARQLSLQPAFDPSIKQLQGVALALDRFYGRDELSPPLKQNRPVS